jgi:hypothetical protein
MGAKESQAPPQFYLCEQQPHRIRYLQIGVQKTVSMKSVLWRGAAVFLIMLLGWYIGRNCGDRKRYSERRPLGENTRKCGLIWWIEKNVIEIIQRLLCFWKWSLFQNWRILAIVRRGSCLLVCEPYERYYWLLEIMSNPICCGRSFSLPTFDKLRKTQISQFYRYHKTALIPSSSPPYPCRNIFVT